MKQVCLLLEVKKIRTTPFHPRTDGQTERAKRTIKERITSSDGPWDKELPFVVFAINSTPSAATKLSPFQLLYGRHPTMVGLRSARTVPGLAGPNSPFEYVKHLHQQLGSLNRVAKTNSEKSKEDAKRRYDASHDAKSWVPFQVGEKVKYRNYYPDRNYRKFSARFRGPFVIHDRRRVNYKIGGGKERLRWVHHDELLPWRDRSPDEVLLDSRGLREGGSRPDSEEVENGGMNPESSSDSGDSDSDAELAETTSVLRRSLRSRRPPSWMRAYEV